MFERRELILNAAAASLAGAAAATTPEEKPMYGLIGKMLAQPGKRDELIGMLAAGTGIMPGCLSYVIATDPTNPDAIWITEVWDSQASHRDSLQLPNVQATISKARPLIAGFGEWFETNPVGGAGLPR